MPPRISLCRATTAPRCWAIQRYDWRSAYALPATPSTLFPRTCSVKPLAHYSSAERPARMRWHRRRKVSAKMTCDATRFPPTHYCGCAEAHCGSAVSKIIWPSSPVFCSYFSEMGGKYRNVRRMPGTHSKPIGYSCWCNY